MASTPPLRADDAAEVAAPEVSVPAALMDDDGMGGRKAAADDDARDDAAFAAAAAAATTASPAPAEASGEAGSASEETLYPFGVPREALLAPVPPPSAKKPRHRTPGGEFTIAQKLEILAELRGPDAPSVLALATRHGTSRTTLYRWKQEESRMIKLCRKDKMGDRKRASRKRKVRKNEEYTAAEKLEVLRELKRDDVTVQDLAIRTGTNRRAIYRWRKHEERLKRLVEQEGMGGRKRAGDDPLRRIKEALGVFHAEHYANPAAADDTADGGTAGDAPAPPPLTGTIIANKAKQIRDVMLARHEETPFLTESEVRGMKEFTASASWGRKMQSQWGWKGDGGNGGDAIAVGAAAAGGSAVETEVGTDDAGFIAATSTTGGVRPVRGVRGKPMLTAKFKASILKKQLDAANRKLATLEAQNDRLKRERRSQHAAFQELQAENARLRRRATASGVAAPLLESEAENARLRAALAARVEGNEAENARLRAALGAVPPAGAQGDDGIAAANAPVDASVAI